ncbi:aromatic acid/H+ symport family MFS transporter [Erwinia tracheiphila]|uniref:MFS transporter n=1 Tax=Erwinia tracheiphila TaxID=65700 RepID=A0A345CR53_9GAMM|nr:aromatic acid/H+ symport family MFS transporter [Erwinia tracheiphila]AXF75920.1 MFS transporter [Erwinia tracheiphila]UIA85419.1 aromatic acid/H+ symport family MFS transporter [Erwinia tracheiphila]UIA93940.1 aromatic acid/H+ symport family MFS transporter [Erwinia tracheiphila]
MESLAAADVRTLINEGSISRYQLRIIILCFAVVAMDGMDIAVMGFIAPSLKAMWGVTMQQLGVVISAALIGLALGAMLAGPLADRFGRRMIIISSVFFFGLWTLISAFSQDIDQMVLFRFLTGLGLGAAMPNVGTLIAEYSPARKRAFIITVVFCGFTLGAAGGGFAASWLIPTFGWHAVLIVGGLLPLLIVPVLISWLPESVRFLLAHNASSAQIHRIVEKMAPGKVRPGCEFTLSERSERHSSVRLVTTRPYLLGSTMLWGGYFMGLFLVYLIGSWLPSLIKDMGMTVTQAALITAMYQAGGTVGSLFAGWMMDRFNANLALASIYFVGAIATVSIGYAPAHTLTLSLVAFSSGFCLNGANTGMNALSASYYPTHARATGSSWMHGVGRIGAILSAFAGAEMLSMGWNITQVFTSLAIPATLTSLMLLVKYRYAYHRSS